MKHQALALDRFDEAKNCFLKAVRLAPKNTAGWLGLRHIALLKGDIPTYLRSTCAILPHLDASVIAKTVEVLLDLHHRHEALEVITSADGCSKTGEDLDAQRLVVYRLENIHEAKQIVLYKRLRSLPTLSDGSLRALGKFEIENKDFASALGHLKKIRDQDAGSEYLIIKSLLALGDTKETAGRIARAIEEWPTHGAFRFLSARLAIGEGDREAARARLIEALDFGFYVMDEMKEDPELSHLFTTLAAKRPEGEARKEDAT